MVMLAMFITAIEGTIVSTAMPSIVSELHGFESFTWAFSIFLLMQAVTIPIYGKLSDLYGRKPIFFFGMVTFLIGSVLCGLATSMEQLIIYRLVQGLGAGAVQPLTMTIISDVYPPDERGKIQGYLSSVWAISSVLGPALGGLFVEYISWVWVFWINVPFGIVTMIGLHLYFHEQVEKKKPSIDYAGSFLLLITIGSLMTLFVGSGSIWEWASLPTYLLAPAVLVGAWLFILRERVAPEPVMPLSLWKHRTIVISNIAALSSHIVLIGISAFLPTYVQGIMGYSPLISGLTLGMMSIGWPLASTIGGRYMHRIGLRRMSVLGCATIVLGSVIFILLKPEYGPVYAGVGSFLSGVGFGLLSTASLLIVQASTDWNMRGSATALIMFMRISGSTIGASVLASVLNNRYIAHMKANAVATGSSLDLNDANLLLDPARPPLDPDVVELLRDGLTLGLNSVYWSIGLVSLLTFALILFLPKQRS
jgi:EmrB/QacA subfamily drug resistance transporter